MEKTKTPKQIIQSYLEERAKNDPLFASVYAKPNKNINECFDYILSEAKKRGNAVCMSDDEVFSLAVHYYDEDDIEVGKAVNCGVIVNHRVELSPEEQAEARENALKAYQNEELRKIQQRNSKPKPTPKAVRQEPEQPTLFDLGL